METIDICGGTQGNIWGRKPLPRQSDGFVIGISNTRVGLTAKGRRVPFTKVAFGRHGSWFVAVDQLGTLYSFDMSRNKYKMVHRFGQTCTAVTCSHAHPNEVFIATVDTDVKCINIDTHQTINTYRPHDSSVKAISLHHNGRYLLVVTQSDSVLWDVQNGHRYKTLSGGETVGVQNVLFLPLTNSILTCFRDDSIHVWEADTLEYKYNLPVPAGPLPRYRAFAVTQNGSLLVAGGRSNTLHIWDMIKHTIKQVIELPPKMASINSIFFVTEALEGQQHCNNMLAVLSHDGVIRFINIDSCKPLFQIGATDNPILSAAIDCIGHNIVVTSQHGDLIIYNILGLVGRYESSPLVIGLEEDTPSVSSFPSKTRPSSSKKTPNTTQSRNPIPNTPAPPTVSNVGGVKIDIRKLKSILKGYGEYPSKYRSFIWRSLLQLPDNHSAYSVLLAKGTHPAFINLHDNYPMKSPKLLRILQRVLSAIAHWCSLFAEVDYLPAFVFPFVKYFQNNQLVAFEVVTTILFNWCDQWFSYFPNPPFNILTMVENLLSYHDPHLLNHLVHHHITVRVYVWPLLSTIFSEILSKDEWLKLWDNVLSQPPSFLLMVTAAYVSAARQSLMKCTKQEDMEYFVHHPSSVNLTIVLQDAYRMQEATPIDIHPKEVLGEFIPLTKRTYPVFNKYPEFIVDYQLKERERIMKEEQELIRQRQQTLELERIAEQRKQSDECWQRQQVLLLEAEEDRRRMVELEDQKLSDQRIRLAALKRETKMKELRTLDEARHRYLEQQQRIRENEIKKMDKDIQRKILLRDRETHEVIQDVELRTLELQAQRTIIEQELAQRHDQAMYKLKKDYQLEQDRLTNTDFSCDPLLEKHDDNEIRHLQMTQAKLDVSQTCQMDEDVASAHCELHRLRTELKDQELKERKQMCEMEEERLRATVGHLQDTDTTSIRTTDIDSFSSISDANALTTYQDEVLRWSQQRLKLDHEEAELLTKINNLRRKVATRMMGMTVDQPSF